MVRQQSSSFAEHFCWGVSYYYCPEMGQERKNNNRCSVPLSCNILQQIMGGVDLMDSLIVLYRTAIRSKKWYHRIVFHLLDLTVVNAWLLYRRGCRSCNVNTKDQISLRDFKISVAACLCQEKKGKTKKRGRSNFSSLQAEIDVKKKKRTQCNFAG